MNYQGPHVEDQFLADVKQLLRCRGSREDKGRLMTRESFVAKFVAEDSINCYISADTSSGRSRIMLYFQDSGQRASVSVPAGQSLELTNISDDKVYLMRIPQKM